MAVLRKEDLYHCVLSLNFTLVSRQIQQDHFKMFLQVFKGFKDDIFVKNGIFPERRHF